MARRSACDDARRQVRVLLAAALAVACGGGVDEGASSSDAGAGAGGVGDGSAGSSSGSAGTAGVTGGSGGSGGTTGGTAGVAGAPTGGTAGVAGAGATGGGEPGCGVGGVNRCGLPAAPGDCDGSFPRWYFDVPAGQCMQFVYGGCGGNQNNFQSLDECAKACEHRADGCALCDANATCTPHDCAACPETRFCSGTTCSLVGHECTFGPSCGATTCTCRDDTGESAAWECISNLC